MSIHVSRRAHSLFSRTEGCRLMTPYLIKLIIILLYLPMQLIYLFFKVFQNRIVLSAVPPPLTSNPCYCGFHVIAFTAALCSLNLNIGEDECKLHTNNLLSLPPDANYYPSRLHLSPQTSYRCALNF